MQRKIKLNSFIESIIQRKFQKFDVISKNFRDSVIFWKYFSIEILSYHVLLIQNRLFWQIFFFFRGISILTLMINISFILHDIKKYFK